MSEEILCVVETVAGAGYLEEMLYFTSNRLIIAKIESKAARFDPTGVVGLVSLFKRGKKVRDLSKLSPEGILGAGTGNVAIPYVEITKVELFKKMRGKKIRIITATEKREFWLSKPKEFEKCVDMLRPVLADKLSIS